jgi:alkylation response protein AidB-like acyl-CoA dehydrogenase
MSETDADIQDLSASFRAVLDDAVAAGVVRRHVDDGAVRCDALWSKAAELGWFALLTPEAHGGLGLDRRAAGALYEELGRVTAPLPMLGSLIATETLATHADAALQDAWLPRLAAGAGVGLRAAALEPDWNGIRVDGGFASGEASGLLDGPTATGFLLAARAGGAAAWVFAESAVANSEPLMDRTRGLARLQLEGAAVSVLGNDANRISRDVRTHASIGVASDSLGGAKAVLDLTVAYLKTREQFGKPIGSFQALKHRCADHKVAVEAADALVRDAIERWARDDADAGLYAALAKALACDAYANVAMDAVQLHGGIGFTWEHVCHVYLKRAKLNQTLFGGSAAHRDHAANLLARAS